MTKGLTRDFTVATFVVHASRVLMVRHRKLQLWLPPGGHIDENELPDEAAVREVAEETGLACELVGEPGLEIDYPRQLLRPEGIQVEDISPGHQHIDLIYFARLTGSPNETPSPVTSHESESAGWYTLVELDALPVPPDVRAWAERAIARVERATNAETDVIGRPIGDV